MQQYFVKGQEATSSIRLTDKDTIKHMFTVMRLRAGDRVVLVFDNQTKWLAEVTDSQTATFDLVEELLDHRELPVQVTIASAFPKGDKLEWITQKVTELGASRIWAFPSAWSMVKWDSKKLSKKADKLAKIAQGAAEQSKRNVLPEVELFDSQRALLERFGDFDVILLAYEESAKAFEQKALAKAYQDLQPGQKLLLIFGPEGGIAPEEVRAFEAAGAVSVGLGPRILRAETAPLYALSSLSYALELVKTSKRTS